MRGRVVYNSEEEDGDEGQVEEDVAVAESE